MSFFRSLVIQLNALLGRKARSLKDLTDYWDVAAYFELHAIQYHWLKACQAALHMYLLNPPTWHLKSTINNVKILHRATCLRDQQRFREQTQPSTTEESIYSFWIDFFTDAINSNSTVPEERELPAQVPVSTFASMLSKFVFLLIQILVCDNYEKTDGTTVNNIYVEAHLQLNFHTSNEPETLVIRILEQQNQIRTNELVRRIDMNTIRSLA